MADPTYSDRPTTTGPVGKADGLSALYGVALALAIIGGINWGLVGLFQFDLVAAIFGEGAGLTRLVYIVVGIAALVSLGCYSRLRRPAY